MHVYKYMKSTDEETNRRTLLSGWLVSKVDWKIQRFNPKQNKKLSKVLLSQIPLGGQRLGLILEYSQQELQRYYPQMTPIVAKLQHPV